jgi:hypothetical protein
MSNRARRNRQKEIVYGSILQQYLPAPRSHRALDLLHWQPSHVGGAGLCARENASLRGLHGCAVHNSPRSRCFPPVTQLPTGCVQSGVRERTWQGYSDELESVKQAESFLTRPGVTIRVQGWFRCPRTRLNSTSRTCFCYCDTPLMDDYWWISVASSNQENPPPDIFDKFSQNFAKIASVARIGKNVRKYVSPGRNYRILWKVAENCSGFSPDLHIEILFTFLNSHPKQSAKQTMVIQIYHYKQSDAGNTTTYIHRQTLESKPHVHTSLSS